MTEKKHNLVFGFQVIGLFILGILASDFFGFVIWVVSGQTPVDQWYVGTITAHILRLFIN